MDVTLPNGYVIKGVPDDTPKEVIMQKAIAGGFAVESDFAQAAQPEDYGDPVVNEQGQYQVGGGVDLLDNNTPFLTGASALERLFSGAVDQREALLSNLSGAAAVTVAPIGGGLQMIAEDVKSTVTGNPANPLAGPQARDRIANTMTYQPRTLGGKRIVEGQAELLAPVAETMEKARLGDEALEMGAPEWVARNAEAIPEYIMAGLTAFGLRKPSTPKTTDKYGNVRGVDKNTIIRDKLKAGEGTGATAKYELDAYGNKISSPAGKAALGQGWDDITVAGTKAGNEATRLKIRRMVGIGKERLTKNATAKDKIELRPSNVAGESLHDRYKFIAGENQKAGRSMKNIATYHKDRINISGPVDWLKKELSGNGITVKANGKLDFSMAKLPAEDFTLIKENWRQMNVMLNKGDTFLAAHELKQMMRRNGLSYGQTTMKAGASPDVQSIYKGFSSKIDEILDARSPMYDAQNIKYGATRDAMNKVEKIAKDSLFSESPESNLGTLTKRMMGNPVSRQAVIHYSKELDKVAKQYGGKFDDDLFLQAYVANDMDKVIEVAAQTSLKGEAGAQALQALDKSSVGKAAHLLDQLSRFAGRRSEQKAMDTLQGLTPDRIPTDPLGVSTTPWR